MRRASVLAILLASTACDLRAPHRTDDPELARNIADLTRVVLERPDDLPARRRLADAHLAAEHWFVAAEIYKQVADVAPQDARALAGLADAYLKLAYYPQAYQALSRGVTLTEGPEECMLRLGLLLRSDGSPEGLGQAKRVLDGFLARAPDHPRAEEARAVVRQLEVQLTTTPGAQPAGVAPGAAVAPVAAAATASVAAPLAARGVPEHSAATGDEKVGALNAFGAALGRALEAVRKNDAPGAEAALKEALTHRPDDVGALALLAETYMVLSRPDDARRAAAEAYRVDPRDSQARWAYGLVNVRTKGDMAGALTAWRALVKDDPEFARQAGVTAALEQAEKMLGQPLPR